MITAAQWVPRGFAAPFPKKYTFDEEEFEIVTDAIQEILSASALSGGAGSKTLTEPLLVWCERYGNGILQRVSAGMIPLTLL